MSHGEPGLAAGVAQSLRQRAALMFTTNPGLEDIVAEELAERLAPLGLAGELAAELRPFGFGGQVLALLPRVDEAVTAAALQMRSVHHAIHPLYGVDLDSADPDPLGRLEAELRERGIPQLARPGVARFRVTTHRSGQHPFTSIDVQRRAGAALVARYGLAVDLRRFDCEVRVDVVDRCCLVGVQLTGDPLSRRQRRLYNPRAALKANVAYALLRLARLPQGRLLDPFCGSGTIPIEAAQLSAQLEIEASDGAALAAEGARRNIEAAGLTPRIPVACRDMCDLADLYPAGHFDAIVTNPPFGVRLGRGLDFLGFYSRFLDVAAHLLRPGGRLVLLAWKRGVIDRANRPARQFRRAHVRVVETGGIYPRIYVLERRPERVVHRA